MKLGGFSRSGYFHGLFVPLAFFLYNLFNVAWAGYTIVEGKWCVMMAIGFLFLQLTSFCCYLFAYRSFLNFTTLNETTFTQFLSSPSSKLLAMVLIPTVITYISGLCAFLDFDDGTNGNVSYMILTNVSMVFDVIRYLPLTVITLILHQILESFPRNMVRSFDLRRTFEFQMGQTH